MYNDVVPEAAEEISRRGEGVFLLTAKGISRLDLQSGDTVTHVCHTDQRTLLAMEEDEILLCSPQKAEYIRFDR